MFPAPIAPHLSAFAPDFARRFALITASLAALVARAFLRNPSLVLFIIPLYKRLTRASRRCTALMALLAAGKTPRPRRVAQRSGIDSDRGALAQERSRTPTPQIPRSEAWLIQTLRHEAANYASQLAHLLAEPAAAELLAATPAASHLLRPICRLLGLSAIGRNSAAHPAEAAPPPNAPALPALPPPPPAMPPPPCPHVGWPWFPATAQPAVASDRAALGPRERPRPAAKPT